MFWLCYMLTIYVLTMFYANYMFFFFQTMADKHDRDVEYDLEEEFEDSEEFEDLPSEHETELSDDEFDDQGLDDYGHYPDYIRDRGRAPTCKSV